MLRECLVRIVAVKLPGRLVFIFLETVQMPGNKSYTTFPSFVGQNVFLKLICSIHVKVYHLHFEYEVPDQTDHFASPSLAHKIWQYLQNVYPRVKIILSRNIERQANYLSCLREEMWKCGTV